MKSLTLYFLLLAIAFLPTPFRPGAVADEQPDAEGIEFFEKKIRPVLVLHCYECHSSASTEIKGELRLDSRPGMLRGGESGPAIVPGKPNQSLLIAALRHQSLEMPPEEKLPDATIRNFTEWIQRGAPDPRSGPAQPEEVAQQLLEATFAKRLS